MFIYYIKKYSREIENMENFGNSSKYFRESLKGFNKDDVIQFVTKMMKEYSDAEDKYKEDLAASEATIIKKTEEAAILKRKLDTSAVDMKKKTDDFNVVQKKYTILCEEYEKQRALVAAMPTDAENSEELRKQIDNLNAMLDERETEKLSMSEAAEEADRKIMSLEEEIFALKKENEELIEIKNKVNDLTANEEKIYEKITAELGNVIYSANRTAENIIEKATAEAEDIMNKANLKRTAFFEEYENDVSKLRENLEAVKESYRNISEKFKISYESFSVELFKVEQTLEEIYDKF